MAMTTEEIKAKLAEFREALPIDKDALERECMQHSTLYDQIGEFVAALREEARIVKNRMDFVFADLKKKIREAPAKYGVPKVNNDTILEAATVQPEYVKVLQEYSDALYLSDCGVIVREAAEHRKANLRDAVSLFVHQYYNTGTDNYSKKMLTDNSEEEVLAHRRQRMAAQRAEDTQEDNHVESH